MGDLIDRDRLHSLIQKTDPEDPYIEVLERVEPDLRAPSTASQYRNYVNALAIRTCGGKHENTFVEEPANSCPLRDENIACLHGLDFRYIGPKGDLKGLRLGPNIWGIRLFALSYCLNELGYPAPLFVHEYWDNFSRSDLLDNEAATHYHDAHWNKPIGQRLGQVDAQPDIISAQRIIGEEFKVRYCSPIQSAMQKFWDERIDENM